MSERKYHYETIDGKKKRVYEEETPTEQATQEQVEEKIDFVEPSPSYTQEDYKRDKEKYPQPLVNMCKTIVEEKDNTPQEDDDIILVRDDLPTTQIKVKHPSSLLTKIIVSLFLTMLFLAFGVGLAYFIGVLVGR